MKKKNILNVLLISTTILGGLAYTTPIFATDTVDSSEVSQKASIDLDMGAISKYEISKLNKVKKSNVSKDLPDGITENDVTAVIGYGKDMDGNEVQLNLSKDLFGNYYFDDQTNNTRIQVSDFSLMGTEYSQNDRLPGSLLWGGISPDGYPKLNDTAHSKGYISSNTSFINNATAVQLYKTIKENMKYYKDKFGYEGTNNDGKKNKLLLVSNASNPTDWFNAQMVTELISPGTAVITGIGGETAEITTPTGEKVTAYGDNFAKSKSIIAHEYAHRVAMNLSKSSGLPTNETMAADEAIADMFAASKTKQWKMAMDVTHTNRENWEVGRDLSNPSKYIDAVSGLPFPDKYSDLANGKYDVHNMSTVLGKAYYLITEGGTFNGYDVKGVGLTDSEQLLYKAVGYLGHEIPYTGFSSIRQAFEKAADDSYPEYKQNIEDAFNATEIPSSSNINTK